MKAGVLQVVPERDPRILFDKVVAYYFRNGFPIPISATEFQEGLRTRFTEDDGMFFPRSSMPNISSRRRRQQSSSKPNSS